MMYLCTLSKQNMIELGKHHTLTAKRLTPQGMYLTDSEGNEILLPTTFFPNDFLVGDEIEVFVYNDSEDRPVATTLEPWITLGQYAVLPVRNLQSYGAFFEWGLPKNLLVPNALQLNRIREEDEEHIVYLTIDIDTNRLVGTTIIEEHLDNSNLEDLKPGDEVDLLVFGKSDLGMKVIVNQKHEGLIYHDDIFKPLKVNDSISGFIKKVREDNKLDITLELFGYRKVEPGTEKILSKLKANKGFLPYGDKTPPDIITREFQMSKKVFKKAIGALYRQRVIDISEEGIKKL